MGTGRRIDGRLESEFLEVLAFTILRRLPSAAEVALVGLCDGTTGRGITKSEANSGRPSADVGGIFAAQGEQRAFTANSFSDEIIGGDVIAVQGGLSVVHVPNKLLRSSPGTESRVIDQRDGRALTGIPRDPNIARIRVLNGS